MRLLLALVLLAGAVCPQQILIVKKKVAGCTTPSGTILTESFGDSSTSCWSAGPSTCNNTWSNGSAAFTVAVSPGTPPANTACANSLRVNFTGSDTYIYRSVAETAALDIVFGLYVHASSIANGGVTQILGVEGSDTVGSVRLSMSGAQSTIHASGAVDSTAINISLDTWYAVTLHLDATPASSSITVGGTTQTFTRGNYSTTSIWVRARNLYLTGSVDYYIGNLRAN